MARILVTDDHPFFRLGVGAILDMGGHHLVATANDAAETRAAIESADPEIILLDVRLPEVDGISILESLRRAGDNRPVIILTVELSDQQLVSAIRQKVDGIVFKHEGETKLLEAIEAVQRGLRYIDSQLLDRAMDIASKESSYAPPGNLTKKEREIAKLVAAGLRNRDIAAKLDTTEGTVKVYLHNIYKKCSITNRAELAALTAQAKL